MTQILKSEADVCEQRVKNFWNSLAESIRQNTWSVASIKGTSCLRNHSLFSQV